MKNDSIAPLPPEADSSISLGMIYSLILRRSWLIGLCFLAAVLLAIAYILLATPLYESTAVLEVQKVEQLVYTPVDKDAQSENTPSDDTEVKTIEQALQLDGLFESVVTNPAVVADKNFLPGLGFTSSDTPTTEGIASRFKKHVEVKLLHGTRLIDVSVDHPDAATAQLLATTLVDTFIAENGRSQTDTTKAAMSFLEGQTTRFKADLQKAQDALQVYGETLQLKDQITDQQKVVLELSQRYRPKHPKLIQAKSELAQLEDRFDTNIRTVVANSPNEAAYWNANLKNLDAVDPQSRIESELNLVEARTNVLQREGETQSALFDSVLKQMREADIGKENAPVSVDVVQAPSLPDSPAKPRKFLVLALAGLGGLAIGVIAVFVSHGLDNSLKTVEEVEQFLNLPVLGSLPLVRKPGAERGGLGVSGKKNNGSPGALSFYRNLVLLGDPEGNAAENFRSLRAAIELLGKEKDHRVVLFSSAITDEGKTFTSCNYAVSLAQQGLKTLLIDADLRVPAVAERFELPAKTMGLIEHVSLGVAWDEVIQRNVVENLDILLPGVKSPNPAEFLSGDGLKDVIRQALTKYDRVVLDTPPINAVSDTLLIAPYAQAVCLVVRAKMTPKGAVERAVSMLQRSKIRPVGIVFNCISTDWKSPYSMPKYYYADSRYGQAYVKVND
jgi:capsular exopolysaccharide synthesis family protein